MENTQPEHDPLLVAGAHLAVSATLIGFGWVVVTAQGPSWLAVALMSLGLAYLIYASLRSAAVAEIVPGMLRLVLGVIVFCVITGVTLPRFGFYKLSHPVPKPPPVAITATTLPGGIVGRPYSAQITASGGNGGPYTFYVIDTGKSIGPEPIGIRLSCAPGNIPIIVPPHTTSYVFIANKAKTGGSTGMSIPVIANNEAVMWPSRSLEGTESDRTIIKCGVSTDASVRDVQLDITLEYSVNNPIANPYPAVVTIEHILKGETTSVYFVNSCPADVLITMPTSGVAKRAADGSPISFAFAKDESQHSKFQLSASHTNWTGPSCG